MDCTSTGSLNAQNLCVVCSTSDNDSDDFYFSFDFKAGFDGNANAATQLCN